MLIRAANKEILIDANLVKITVEITNNPSKDEITIVAYAGNAVCTLGEYPDKESAIIELDSIMQFFNSYPTGIYQFK